MQHKAANRITLKADLMKVMGEIKRLFFEGSLQSSIQNYRRISKVLVYFEKYFRFFYKNSEKMFQQMLMQCIKLIDWFVQSSEYTNFGHNFPLFAYLTNKLNNFQNLRLQVKGVQSKQSILRRIVINETSPLYKFLKKREITNLELNLIKKESTHELIPLIEQKKIILQNPSCVSCSEVFVRESIILNSNPIFANILATMETNHLQKLLNCIANQEGGVIILGALNIQNLLRPIGIKILDLKQFDDIQFEIRQAIAKLKPCCEYFIQKVQVKENFLLDKKYQNELRFCFRVFIFPQYKKLTYLQLTAVNKFNYYDIYHFDAEKNPVEVKFKQEQDGIESVYTKIHQKYLKRIKQKVNSHQGILCHPPIYDFSNLLNNFTAQTSSTICQNKQTPKKSQLIPQSSPKIFGDAPHFKYAFTTLLVVNTNKDDREISTFFENLSSKKKDVDLNKAFPGSFKSNIGDRSVWILSHEMNLISLKLFLKVLEDKGVVKPVIKLLSVENSVQIYKNKFSSNSQKNFLKKFRQRYEDNFILEESQYPDKNNEKKSVLIFTFVDFEQAIYGHMILEEMKIKTYFTKQGKVFQK